jgi:arylsulfatase A-like enzyme
LIGKWHLGYKPEFNPNRHGFDYFFGLKSGYHDYYTHNGGDGKPDFWENDQPIEVRGYTTDLVTQQAVKFIEQNAARPFFIDGLQRTALAVPGARRAVRSARQCSPRDAR